MEYEGEHRLKQSYIEGDFKHNVFRNCQFESCDFSQASFSHAKLIDCRFVKCNLSLVKWDGCRLQNVQFNECKVVGANFGKCDPTFLSLSFKKCLIDMGNFSDLDLKNTAFIGSVVRDTHFSHVNLTGADFRDCDLNRSLFHQCDLSKSNFISAVNFSISPLTNKLKNARFSKETALHLLDFLGIILE